jgi:hypothetical protein
VVQNNTENVLNQLTEPLLEEALETWPAETRDAIAARGERSVNDLQVNPEEGRAERFEVGMMPTSIPRTYPTRT